MIAKRSWAFSDKKLLIGYLLTLLFYNVTSFANQIITFKTIDMLGTSASIDSLFQSIVAIFAFLFIYDVVETINGMILQSLGTRLTCHFRKTYYEYTIKNLAVNPDYYWLDEWDKTEMYNSIKRSSESLKSIWSNMFSLVEKSLRLILYTVTMIYMLFQKVDIFNKWTIPLFLIPTLMFIFKKSMTQEIKDSKEIVNKLNSKNISIFNMIDNKFIHGQQDILVEMINDNFEDQMKSDLDIDYKISKQDNLLGIIDSMFIYMGIAVALYTGNFSTIGDFVVTCGKFLNIVSGVSSGISGFIKKLSGLSEIHGDYLQTESIEKQIEKQLSGQFDRQTFEFDNDFLMTFENIQAELVRKDNEGIITNRFTLKQTGPIGLRVGEPVSINGESGSGKSTLLKVMSGLKRPISLDMNINNYETLTDYSDNILGICDHIVYCRQDSLSFIKGTLHEIITGKKKSMITAGDIPYIRSAARFSNIDFANVEDDAEVIHFSSVSGGQRARLTIANIMYNIMTTDKPIIFLDEIDKGLNPQLAVDIYMNILKKFSRDRVIVVISHFDEVKQLFRRSITIDNGVIGEMVMN